MTGKASELRAFLAKQKKGLRNTSQSSLKTTVTSLLTFSFGLQTFSVASVGPCGLRWPSGHYSPHCCMRSSPAFVAVAVFDYSSFAPTLTAAGCRLACSKLRWRRRGGGDGVAVLIALGLAIGAAFTGRLKLYTAVLERATTRKYQALLVCSKKRL